MKHLFVVYNHFSFIISKNVIKYKGIQNNDVYYVCARNYKNKYENFKALDLSAEFNEFVEIIKSRGLISLKNRKRIKQIITNIDTQLLEFVTGQYILYSCHYLDCISHILATNIRCQGINYCEEGITVFSPFYFKDTTYNFKKLIKFFLFKTVPFLWNRAVSLGTVNRLFFMNKSKPEFYTISNDGYKDINYKKIVIPFVVNPNVRLDYNYPVFIAEQLTLWGTLTLDEYTNFILKIFAVFHKDIKDLYIKFHPWNNGLERERITGSLKAAGINVFIIDDAVPLEAVFYTQKMTVIGINSSLLYYAQLLGCTVYRYDAYLQEENKNYKEMQNLQKLTPPQFTL